LERKNRKNVYFLLLKFLVSGIFLFVVFKKAGVREILSHLTTIKPGYFILAVLIYIMATYISAFRWKILLDEDYPVGKLFSLYMIGGFFNNVMPGLIGGDAVKVYYLYSDTKRGGSSLGSVFMDRYVGFFAMLIIGLIAGVIVFSDLKKIGMHMAMPVLFIVFILGSIAVFSVRIGRRFSAVSDFYDYFHAFIKKKMIMFRAFSISVVIQLMAFTMVYIIAAGLGQSLSFGSIAVFMPIILAVSTIPISISGFGVRESAFVVLFGLVGLPPEVAASISFLWFLSIAAASLIGLVEFLRYRKKSSK
jgi:uncharacterized membrane protein YbhN (UPF0104 family)